MMSRMCSTRWLIFFHVQIRHGFDFEQAKDLLESNDYDIAILDIMGVKGFELLKVSTERKIPALMLTAHGMSEENLNKSAQEGADYYAPKEEIQQDRHFCR